MELEYFCKTHNKLCCAACLSKIKDEKMGNILIVMYTKLKKLKMKKELFKRKNRNFRKFKK